MKTAIGDRKVKLRKVKLLLRRLSFEITCIVESNVRIRFDMGLLQGAVMTAVGDKNKHPVVKIKSCNLKLHVL